MVNALKKFVVIALALTLALGVAAPTFAATSPTTKKAPVTKDNVKDSNATKNVYKVYKYGDASLKKLVTPNKKTVTVPTSMTYDGIKYKVTVIRKNAFAKAKKIKTLNIGDNIKRIDKHAFRKSKIKTIKFTSKKLPKKISKGAFKKSKVKTIKVTKKMSKKNFNKLKKMLKKAGFKGKIKRY